MKLGWMFVLAAACGAPASPADPAHPARPAGGVDDSTCPLQVPGTSVTVEDAPDGIALVFVTTGVADQVRQRGTALAEAYNRHANAADTLAAMLAGDDATAAATDIEGGSRVVFTAATPEGAPKLQSDLRMHAQHLSAGTCKMVM